MKKKIQIPRMYFSDIVRELNRNAKIIVLFGPRQVGKTTLARKVLSSFSIPTLEINADLGIYNEVLSSRDIQKLRGLVSGYEFLFIDEAQRIDDIGINLKIFHDQFPQLKILVTASSSLELASQTREALTGRTLTYALYPISLLELSEIHTHFEIDQLLEDFLIFGMYPEIVLTQGHQLKIRYLRELVSAYLYKDVLELVNIKHADKLIDLLRLLAFQIGSQVSISELGRQLGLAKETVESYLDLLEKSFVIFRLRAFSRNPRKEISKMSKYYFYDLGVRNALIENFNTFKLRNDLGQLWENFLIVERKKKQSYQFSYSNQYFWRNYAKQEVDYIEEGGGKLMAFEFKFNAKKVKAPSGWKAEYPASDFELISKENYMQFLL